MLRLDIVYTMHVITKNITIEKKIETRKKKAVEERAQLKLQKNEGPLKQLAWCL